MTTIEISYRFKADTEARPDCTDWIDESELGEAKHKLAEIGGYITGTRTVSWQEQLAAMENAEL